MEQKETTINNVDKEEIKKKISESLENLNQSSQVFENMINDYKILYDKYINIQILAEQNQRLNSIQISKVQENVSKMDPDQLQQAYSTLHEEFMKAKNSKEETLVNLTKNLQTIMDLKGKLEQKDKKINALSAENSALKQQNMLLDKRNKELNEINQTQEKELLDAKKKKQKIETEHKKLLESTGKMLMEIELLRNKVLELQENNINKMNNYNELIESAKQKQMAADMYFQEKQEQFKETNKNNLDLNEKFGSSEEVKIPNKLKFKQKIHNKVITSITFNNFGSSFITTGADYITRVYDAAKNAETNTFSGFSSSVSEACFDHTEQLVFAGSLDKTAKLWFLKNNKLLSTFTGHIDYINCVKCFHAQQRGLTGSSDRTIREWDFNTKNLVRKYNCVSGCFSLAISQDDSQIISGHLDGTVKLWSNSDKPDKVYDLHEDKVMQIKIIKNDQILTLGKDETIKLFDIRKEQPIYTITNNKIPQYCESSIAISPDNKYFAVGSTKGTIYIVNLLEATVQDTINNKGSSPINSLSWRPFNSQIYVGDSSGYLTIWGK